jgi:hypothetical protein
MLIIFSDITKNSSCQAKQSTPHTVVKYYGDCMKMREDFAMGFGDKRSGFHITTTHRPTRPFSPGNFLNKNNMTVVPRAPYFSLFPRLKIKLNGCRFDIIEVFSRIAGGAEHPHRTRLAGCI